MGEDDATFLATALGYLIGAGSLLLYTPIAFRVLRQKSANGLVLSTWWLKLSSYAISDIYFITRGYPLSTYIETITITVEAAVVLFLVAYYQRNMNARFGGMVLAFVLISTWGLILASEEITAFGQVSTVALNSGALIPQFLLNARTRSKGDYSPVTAGLASVGCAIRLFTTITLTDSDPILMGSFGVAFLLNSALLAQIFWNGVMVEGLSPMAVLTADLGEKEKGKDVGTAEDEEVEMDHIMDNEGEPI